jgi:hypothetical protein
MAGKSAVRKNNFYAFLYAIISNTETIFLQNMFWSPSFILFFHQEFYVKNLLELSEYVPSLHEDILEVICSHFLKIDVSLKSSLL